MLAPPGFELTTSRTVVQHLNQLSQLVGGEKNKKQRQYEDDSKIRKHQSTLRSRTEANIPGDIVLKSQWSLDGSQNLI